MSRTILPVVGISTRSVALPGRRDALRGVFSAYIDCLRASGCEVVLLPPGAVKALGRLDALMLVGGEDLAAETWWSAGTPSPPVDPERDTAEALLVERARGLGMPVLGICRGTQLVNCVLGGSIASFDPESVARHSTSNPAESKAHFVQVAPDTRLASAVKPHMGFQVVSRHVAQIANLGVGLLASAWAEDGSIEAIEAADWSFLGVQWHAEWSSEGVEPNLPLFRWLVEEAEQRIRR